MQVGKTYQGQTAEGNNIRYVAKQLIGASTVSEEKDDDGDKTDEKLEAHLTNKDNIVLRHVMYTHVNGTFTKNVVLSVFKTPQDALAAVEKNVKFAGEEGVVDGLKNFVTYEEV
jgi:hypothetical protein